MDVPIIGDPKTFYFSKDELRFLKPRYTEWQRLAITADALQLSFQSYILQNVLVRLGITDASEYNVNFNIEEGTLELKTIPKPPEEKKLDDKGADGPASPPPPPDPKAN